VSVVPEGMVGAVQFSQAAVQPGLDWTAVGASTLVTALSGASPASAEESACDEEQAAKRQLASGIAKDQGRNIGANLSEGGECDIPTTPQPGKAKTMDELEKSWLS